ncbi:hypothetical protein [Fundidesulfovibrio terrae]|uniref:hypothetical protein n=1 Tax=Fundidesulfovibrio terrae TaxID=2922866 RepID=UPI001FAF68E4|nr:hypothetical protein [Fundidesulfovibrio terrae]
MENKDKLRQDLLSNFSKLEMHDMSLQTNAINRATYELLSCKLFICMKTVVDLANKYYTGTRASQGKIIPLRVKKHFGGDSKTAGVNEINNRLSSSGWKLLLNNSTCKARNFKISNGIEFDLNE